MNAVQLLNATLPAWVTDSFPIIRTVIIVVMVVLSLALTLIVLVQPSNPQGMNAISGQSDTYYSKNKSRTMEGVMRRLTVIISIVLGVLALAFFITLAIYSGGAA
ncbi:MAG: preprotein translocase subunit SecG [Clostridia bacterium]|jgi:preprotein translocase subunit SecG|nr:preprotein translocase subunit SecG [Clostridia bacterium]